MEADSKMGEGDNEVGADSQTGEGGNKVEAGCYAEFGSGE